LKGLPECVSLLDILVSETVKRVTLEEQNMLALIVTKKQLNTAAQPVNSFYLHAEEWFQDLLGFTTTSNFDRTPTGISRDFQGKKFT
jgi:hypothetical protein